MYRTTLTRMAAAGGAAAALVLATAAPATAQNAEVGEPASFTSAFTAMATADEVVANDEDAPAGEDGISGTATFRLNSDQDIICYEIDLEGQETFSSPANTATHIHEGARGEAGPPRLVFPDPNGSDGTLTADGCIQGPFETGVEPDDDGVDAAEGFTVAQIEADPTGFYFDTHGDGFEANGSIRGQLQQVPVDGVDTGAGGTAAGDGLPVVPVALAGLVLAGAAGVLIRRQVGTEAG